MPLQSGLLDPDDQPGILVYEVDHGIEIDEEPKFLTSHPSTSTHSIMIANSIDDTHLYFIPLHLEGVGRYFDCSLPTSAEFEKEEIPHLELTALR
jgi:hypothetical protein